MEALTGTVMDRGCAPPGVATSGRAAPEGERPMGMRERIAAHDWSSTPLGDRQGWSPQLRASVDLMVGHGFPMIVLWGPELIQVYNDGYAEIMADKHPGGLGVPTRQCWPEVWHINGPIYEQVWAGQTLTFRDKCYPLVRNGALEDIWFTLTYSPLHGADGRVEGVLVTLFETTGEHRQRRERELAEQEQRRSEQRLALAFKMLPVGIAITGADGKVVMSNDVMDRYLPSQQIPSDDPANVTGWRSWDENGEPLPPESFPAARALRGETVAPGVEFLHRHGDGPETWTRVAAAPMRDEQGEISGVFVVIVDIDAIKRANERLREKEERFRQFAHASSDVLWVRNAETMNAEMLSTAFETIYSVPREDCMGDLRNWSARVVADDREAAMNTLAEARDGNRRVHEYRIQRPDSGEFRILRDTVFPLFDARGRVTRIAGICSDVTEERRWAQHQSVLLAELQHRVRNIMALIASIAWRTREGATSVDDYAQRLSARVMALGRTQALLTRAANAGIALRALLEEELSAQADDAQYTLQGPEVVLPPKAAEVLALALHELASNALKHGTLTDPQGRIEVSWALAESAGAPWLDIRWNEQRAAVAGWTPPERRGFGTALVEGRVPYELGGTGAIDVRADGVAAHIGLPLRSQDSLLQTDAPVTARVSGGSCDLSHTVRLDQRRVLVLEDDFYLAHDTAAALRSTGAEIVGPVTSTEAALDALREGAFDAAVVDVNLGHGAGFEMIRALHAAALPFVVVTGYDDAVFPDDLCAVARERKPASPAAIVRALANQLP